MSSLNQNFPPKHYYVRNDTLNLMPMGVMRKVPKILQVFGVEQNLIEK